MSSGGLIVPVGGSKAMQDALIGEVLAVGEDVELPLTAGDVVIFSKCAYIIMMLLILPITIQPPR